MPGARALPLPSSTPTLGVLLRLPPVKYVVWSADGSLLALMSKHST